MKQTAYSFLLLCTLLVCGSAGCRHEADDIKPGNPGTTIGTGNSETASNLSSGTWHVSYFISDGDDMSHHLDGYTFVFGSSGILTVNTGLSTVDGNWQLSADGSRQELSITLSAAADPMLAELAEDWNIQASTASRLELIKNGGHPREVHFAKQ
jgi:hypothetical protein